MKVDKTIDPDSWEKSSDTIAIKCPKCGTPFDAAADTAKRYRIHCKRIVI